MNLEKYAFVRGFNYQPPWGSNGRDIWLKFDANEYRRLIVCAKKAFPKLNVLRIWLSFDAWLENSDRCIENLNCAGKIIASEGLKFIPVYFNGWRSIPDFGGFTSETLGMIESNNWEPYRTYLKQASAALSESEAILIHDISNEPYNTVGDRPEGHRIVTAFLSDMAEELHCNSDLPVTVGSQGYAFETPINGCVSDIEMLSPFIDVVSVHPYSIWSGPLCEHREYLAKTLKLAENTDKPILVTECCWDGPSDKARGEIADTEFKNYTEAGIGFIAHALSTSGVADLHPKDAKNPLGYMIFMNLDGSIRQYHECFNKY